MGAAEKIVKTDCNFCNPVKKQPHFAEYGKPNIDSVPIFETDHVLVRADVLPVEPNGQHFLMIPKHHGYSFATLPDFDNDIGQIMYRMEEEFGPMAFFEHGGVKEGSKIQSIYHQHAHLIPTNGRDYLKYMSDVLDSMSIPFMQIDTPDSAPSVNVKKFFAGYNYLFIQQEGKGLIAYDQEDNQPADNFPSQITQLNMSNLLSGERLNWKKIPEDEHLAKESIRRIVKVLEYCNKKGII